MHSGEHLLISNYVVWSTLAADSESCVAPEEEHAGTYLLATQCLIQRYLCHPKIAMKRRKWFDCEHWLCKLILKAQHSGATVPTFCLWYWHLRLTVSSLLACCTRLPHRTFHSSIVSRVNAGECLSLAMIGMSTLDVINIRSVMFWGATCKTVAKPIPEQNKLNILKFTLSVLSEPSVIHSGTVNVFLLGL